MDITPEKIMEAVACANFMQKFKSLLWEKMDGNHHINEEDLDKIAMELYDYIKKGNMYANL